MSDEDEIEDDAETANISFMVIWESSEVLHFKCHSYNIWQSNLDIIIDELQEVINEYNKIAQEKKSRKLT